MKDLVLVGTAASGAPRLQADDYIDLSLTFSTIDVGEHLVLTIDGEFGGWLELVLDVRDGSVVALTITSPLPRAENDVLHGAGPPVHRGDEVPRLEIERLVASSDRAGPYRVLQLTRPLFEASRRGAKVIAFSVAPVSTRVLATGVQFGFGALDELVEIVIEPELLERAEPF